MTTHKIGGDSYSTFTVASGSDTWILTRGNGIAVPGGTAVVLGAGAAGTTFIVNGDVSAASLPTSPCGFYVQAADSRLVVHHTGRIFSDDNAVVLAGDHANVLNQGKIAGQGSVAINIVDGTHRINNQGTISDDNPYGYGVFDNGGSLHIVNSGHISANRAIQSKTGDTTIVNKAGGLIEADAQAVAVDSAAGTHALVRNGGHISAVTAIGCGSGDETIINSGRIDGEIAAGGGNDRLVLAAGSVINSYVMMNDGKDVLDLRHGQTGATIFNGDADNDTYLISSAKTVLMEYSACGWDTVRSTVSYTLEANFEDLRLLGHADLDGGGSGDDNRLYGNSGDNHLNGHGGADMLFGNGGNDVLTGGAGADNFVFASGGGHDRITDFAAGEDIVNIHDYKGVNDFATLSALFRQEGADTVIHFGHGDLLTLENTNAQTLTDADFLF